MIRRLPTLLALALLCAACGTRVDESRVRKAQGRSSVSVESGGQIVAGGDTSTATGTPSDLGAGAPSGTTSGGASTVSAPRRPTNVVAGDRTGATGGVIKVGGVFPLSGGLSALGRPVEQAARAYFRSINE